MDTMEDGQLMNQTMRPPLPPPRDPNRPNTAERKLTRTEFIILFIWKEPTPSDGLRASPGT